MPPIKKLHQSFDVDVKLTPAGQGKVCCTIRLKGVVVATEKAGSRKAAKNKAARVALRKLSPNRQ
jgi:dsRNA-specific ribonuclease